MDCQPPDVHRNTALSCEHLSPKSVALEEELYSVHVQYVYYSHNVHTSINVRVHFCTVRVHSCTVRVVSTYCVHVQYLRIMSTYSVYVHIIQCPRTVSTYSDNLQFAHAMYAIHFYNVK